MDMFPITYTVNRRGRVAAWASLVFTIVASLAFWFAFAVCLAGGARYGWSLFR